MKNFFTFIFAFIIPFGLMSQAGFKELIALAENEPNLGYHVAEDTLNDQYLVSGVYFDQEIGRWTASVATYDLSGKMTDLHTLQNDIVPFLDFCNHSELVDDKYYFLGIGPTSVNIVCYNTLSKQTNVCYSLERFNNRFNQNLLNYNFIYDRVDSSIIICGSTIVDQVTFPNDAAAYNLLGDPDEIFIDETENKDEYSKNIKKNSLDQYVLATLSSLRIFNAERDTTYLYFLDKNLELVRSTMGYPDNPNFRMGKGMVIDHQDNIVITGLKLFRISADEYLNLQGVVKFDQEGKHLWTTYISNSINNVSGWGRWHGIVESVEKDGYIIVGSESYQTETSDTIIAKAAIAKLSYEGDSLWMHTFSYRQGPRIREIFHDVIATSDGGYLAVGASSHFDAVVDNLPWVQTLILKVNSDGLLDTTSVAVLNIDDNPNAINIYPNPVIDKLYITQSLNKKLRISIFNMQGQLLDSYISDDSRQTIILDVVNYFSGTYLLQARDYEGNIYNRKFVVE